MRFPLALTVKIARHIIRHRLKRTPKFAMVLQLEPLHTCNLTCTGCGRIREYETKTAPLKHYYSAQGKFKGIDGVGSMAEITERLVKAIG